MAELTRQAMKTRKIISEHLIKTTVKPKFYIFFSDPGHAWLRVKKTGLVKLGIAHKISRYSYMKSDWAYLEEDCDAGLFLRTKFGGNLNYKELQSKGVLKEKNTNNQSKIRSYDSYTV